MSRIATIRLKSGKKHTYDGNQQTDPQRPLVQCPDMIAKEYLNNEGDECIHRWIVYRGEIGIRKAFQVAESGHEPKVDVGPRKCRLDGLQKENKVR